MHLHPFSTSLELNGRTLTATFTDAPAMAPSPWKPALHKHKVQIRVNTKRIVPAWSPPESGDPHLRDKDIRTTDGPGDAPVTGNAALPPAGRREVPARPLLLLLGAAAVTLHWLPDDQRSDVNFYFLLVLLFSLFHSVHKLRCAAEINLSCSPSLEGFDTVWTDMKPRMLTGTGNHQQQ